MSISDAKVKAATGKALPEWFRLLDRAGAKDMEHRAIADLLYGKHKVPGWWSQMVTVEYERSRKGRRTHQRIGGSYEFNLTKTVEASTAAAYRAWAKPAQRKAWGAPAIDISTARPGKVLRGALKDGSRVAVDFRARPNGKSHVVVTLLKVPTAAGVTKAKAAWRRVLDKAGLTLNH